MAKVIDITNKLGFEERPKLKIKDKEYEVNNSAIAMLEIMPKIEDPTYKEMSDLLNILFNPEDVEDIKINLSPNFSDFQVIIKEAINLVVGKNDDQGETETPATT